VSARARRVIGGCRPSAISATSSPCGVCPLSGIVARSRWMHARDRMEEWTSCARASSLHHSHSSRSRAARDASSPANANGSRAIRRARSTRSRSRTSRRSRAPAAMGGAVSTCSRASSAAGSAAGPSVDAPPSAAARARHATAGTWAARPAVARVRFGGARVSPRVRGARSVEVRGVRRLEVPRDPDRPCARPR